MKDSLARNDVDVRDICGNAQDSVEALDVEHTLDCSKFGDTYVILKADVTYDPLVMGRVVCMFQDAFDKVRPCSAIQLFLTRKSNAMCCWLMKQFQGSAQWFSRRCQ